MARTGLCYNKIAESDFKGGMIMKKYILMSAMVAAAACTLYAQGEEAEKMATPAVKVEKMVTAAGVEKREPVGEAVTFAKGTARVFTWTKITAEQPPVKTKHVYYADGKRVGEVELTVNSSPYRVWSSKAVWPGSWKVEATDEAGNVLATAEFTVGEEAAAGSVDQN